MDVPTACKVSMDSRCVGSIKGERKKYAHSVIKNIITVPVLLLK